MYKTAIIGAGVVGAMAARRLSSYDMDLWPWDSLKPTAE